MKAAQHVIMLTIYCENYHYCAFALLALYWSRLRKSLLRANPGILVANEKSMADGGLRIANFKFPIRNPGVPER